MKQLICIVCPKGCHLSVDEENGFAVTGNGCERGAPYAQSELKNPMRMLTSTVQLKNAAISRLPVKTSSEIAKSKMKEAARLLDGESVCAPVHIGDVIMADILGTGVNFVATRTVPASEEKA